MMYCCHRSPFYGHFDSYFIAILWGIMSPIHIKSVVAKSIAPVILSHFGRYAAKRGTTWLRRRCNVRQRDPSVIKRGRTWSGFLTYPNFEHVQNSITFSATYNDGASTCRQRNYSITWRSTTWLERSRNVQERVQHTYSVISRFDTLWHYASSCYIVVSWHSVGRGGTEATAW